MNAPQKKAMRVNRRTYHFDKLTLDKICKMDESYYFLSLLIHKKYKSVNEFNAIRLWVDKNRIENTQSFTDALSLFVLGLNCQDYNRTISLVNDKKRKQKPPSLIKKPSKPIKKDNQSRKLKEKHSYKGTDTDLKLLFLEWVDIRLLDEYKGKKPSELKYKDKVLEWVKKEISALESEHAETKNSKSKAKTKTELTITTTENSILKQPKTLNSTLIKHKTYFDLYQRLDRVKTLSHEKIIKKIIQKYGVSEKTIDRALKRF